MLFYSGFGLLGYYCFGFPFEGNSEADKFIKFPNTVVKSPAVQARIDVCFIRIPEAVKKP